MKVFILFLALFGLAYATFDLTLTNPSPLTCSTTNCNQRPGIDCSGLNAYAALDNDGCGSSGGHAVYTDFSAARPDGFGEDRWLFEVVNGASTGRLEFYGTGVGSRARLFGSLVGLHNSNDKWDLDVEFQKVQRLSTMAVKNELDQNCQIASATQMAANWDFYSLVGNSVMVGKGINVGCNITLGLDRSNMYHVQVGLGGSEKNARFGLTVWISYLGFTFDDVLWPANQQGRPRFNFRIPSDRMKDGDINVNAYCACQCPNPPPPTPVCGNHIIENGEQCDGGDCCKADCTYSANTVTCRAAVAECDKAETCTGSSSSCPADTFKPNTVTCTESVGFCDVRLPNYCPGNAPNCHGPPSIGIDQGTTSWESFNVISFHNYFSPNGGDVEGRLAVKDNMVLAGGFSIGYLTDTTPGGPDIFVPAALVVGHNASWPTTSGGSIFPDGKGVPNLSYEEGAFVGHSYSDWPPYLKMRVIGTSIIIGDKDAEFEAARTYYTALQATFAAGTPNVVVTPKWGGLFLTCNSNSANMYYVNINGADMSASTWWNLDNCNIQASWVLNIVGTGGVTMQGQIFPGIVERVVFNVLGSGRVITLLTGIGGNLLAPNNIYSQSNGVTKGLVIVGDVTNMVQSNLPRCTKFDPVVISAHTRQRIQGGGKKKQGTTDIPVYSFGSFTLGDSVTVGTETTTIVNGVYDENGYLVLVVSPALVNSYPPNTVITTTVADPLNAIRPQIPVPENPSGTVDQESSSGASTLTIFSGLFIALIALIF